MNKHGTTIVELMSVLLLIGILAVGLGQLYFLGLDLWQNGYERQSAAFQMSQAFERAVRSLRQAQSIDDFSESSIVYTADPGSGPRSYRLYLYNPSDAEPNPPHTQPVYELRLAEGDIAYGDGAVISSQIRQPTDPSFLRMNDLISIDLTRNYLESSLRYRTNVQLRNL